MEKFKICPDCGTKNETNAIECTNCECDLTSVAISTEQQETQNISADKTESENKLFRICDCGEKNPANARKCSNCGEDISDITPTAEDFQINFAPITERPRTDFFLRSLDGRINFKIDRNMIVGRENELQSYLSEKTFVSRKHCRFTLEAGDLFVEDLNSANSTYVNNKKISRKTKLSRGDEVALGGAVFNGERQDKAAYFSVR